MKLKQVQYFAVFFPSLRRGDQSTVFCIVPQTSTNLVNNPAHHCYLCEPVVEAPDQYLEGYAGLRFYLRPMLVT